MRLYISDIWILYNFYLYLLLEKINFTQLDPDPIFYG